MAALLQDLRYSLRTLVKSPNFTIIAVLTLAFGIGANTALFSVVKAVLLNSLPYRQPDRLVTMAKADSDTPNPTNTSFGTVADWKARTQSFESIALYRGWGPTVTGTGNPEVLRGLRVTYNFFDTLGIQPALGRGFLPEEDRPDRANVVLLSHSFWAQRFGADPKVIGTTLVLNEVPFQIVGVLPESFQSLSFATNGTQRDIWAPLGYDLSLSYACRTCQHLRCVARLKDGVSVGQAQAEMRTIETQLAHEFPKEYPADATVIVQPLRETWVGKVQSALWLLLGATGFVLLISCANIANLLLTRAASKRREVAVRTALGASRSRIARQLITETIVLSLLGGLAGVVLAIWGTSFLVQMAPAATPRLGDVHFDAPILLFTLALSMATGVLMGLVPAFQAARVDQREALQQQGGRGMVGSGRSRVRSLLVVSEVALAFVLTVASGLLLKSFITALNVNPGFEPRNLSTVDFTLSGNQYNDDAQVVRREREVLERVSALPGVQAAAIVSVLPGTGAMGNWDQRGLIIQDRPMPDPQVPSVDAYFVSPDYLRAMGIRLERGRDFTAADAESSSPVALVSETTARQMFPDRDCLGKRIQLGGRHDDQPWATIVGVVGDVHHYGLDSPVTPQAYTLYSQTGSGFSAPSLVIRSTVGLQALMQGVREQIWALDKNVPISTPSTMTEILSQSLEQRRFTMSLLAGFGALALFLAAIGIYGVMSYTVAQRTNEIGIRVALGAQSRDILSLVSREGMLQAGGGLLAGLVISLALMRVLSSQLFAVSAIDPVTFGAVLFLLAAVALFACYVPARRATRVDPLVALRYE
jgi:putative ABC transport system permease protein